MFRTKTSSDKKNIELGVFRVGIKKHSKDNEKCIVTSETISDSAECYPGLSVRFESSAACM